MGRKVLGILAGVIVLAVLTVGLSALFEGMRMAPDQEPAAVAPPTPTALVLPVVPPTATMPLARPAPTPTEAPPGPGTPGPPPERLTPGPLILPYTPTPVEVTGPVTTIHIPGKDFGRYSPTSKVLLSAPWGKGDGEYGLLLRGATAGAPGFGVDGAGNIYVLDALNSRVHKYDSEGRRLATYPVDASHDIAVREDGGFYLLDVAKDFVVRAYSPLGKAEATYDINRELVNYPIGVVGLSVVDHQVSVALGTGAHALVKSAAGPVPVESQIVEQFPGQPGRGAPRFLWAWSLGRSAIVKLFARDGTVQNQVQIDFERDLVAPYVDTDDRANIYLCGLLIAEAGPPTYGTIASQRVVVAFTPQGELLGKVEMPNIYLTEARRPMVVSPAGGIYQRQTSQQGVTIVKWELER